ncbi:3',5'-cyclic-nucleotide phosphodiesterase regA [Pelomyxa schiedti]|nr:3',5'-cyclic-nucleotide phosphodiesterase regA [Pelomyxa schiedti]
MQPGGSFGGPCRRCIYVVSLRKLVLVALVLGVVVLGSTGSNGNYGAGSGLAYGANAQVNEWSVCTLEGILALSDTVAVELSDNYITVQKMLEGLTFLLKNRDKDALGLEGQKQAAWEGLVPAPGIFSGGFYDPHYSRISEAWVPPYITQPVDRTANCSCNPYWLQFLNKYYSNQTLGIPCDTFCLVSRLMWDSQIMSSIAPQFDVSIGAITRFWVILSNSSVQGILCPYGPFRARNMTIIDVMDEPNQQTLDPFFVSPETNPTRKPLWSDPYYPQWEMMVQVIQPLYGRNDQLLGGVAAGISIDKTNNFLTEETITPGGFGMLLSKKGCLITAPSFAYTTLFGENFTKNTKDSICLNSSTADFSNFVSSFQSGKGFTTLTLYQKPWIFTYQALEDLPWVLSIASPQENIISSASFSVEPSSVLIKASDSRVVFTILLVNDGLVPVILFYPEQLSFLTSNATGNSTVLSQSSSVVIQFYFTGDLPFTSGLRFGVKDAVTEYNLCFNTEIYVPVSINKEENKALKVGLGVTFAFILVLVFVGVIFSLIIRHFHRKVLVLSQPMSTPDLMKTPAAAVIQKLQSIRDESKLSREDKLALDEIANLIASNKLHCPDYISHKLAGGVVIDAETDAYIMDFAGDKLKDSHANSRLDLKLISEVSAESHNMYDSWSYNIFDETSLPQCVLAIFQHKSLLEYYKIDASKFGSWICSILNGYKANPYHSAMHAVDVFQAVSALLSHLQNELPVKYVFSLLFSSLVHDYGHPGVNNNFLYRTFDPLALQYNGISILENYHITESFKLTLGSSLLDFMNKEQLREFHELVTHTILATDMTRHVETLSLFNAKMAGGGLDMTKKSDALLLCQILIKLADISNPTRQEDISVRWTDLISQEFYLQGDKEHTMGLSKSPFMDRDHQLVAKSQRTFIEFVVKDLLAAVKPLLLPEFAEMLQSNLYSNLNFWIERDSSISRPVTPAAVALASPLSQPQSPGGSLTKSLV